MFAEESTFEKLRAVLQAAGADSAQALVWAERLELTRYAGSRIHQNTAEENETLYLHVTVDGREASGETNRLDAASLGEFAPTVCTAARANAHSEQLIPLPGPQEYQPLHSFEPSTALWTPDERAAAVATVAEVAASQGLTASGAYYTTVRQLAMANTAGLQACHASTSAGLTTLMLGDSGSGYGDGYARDARQINPLEIAEIAASKATLSSNPRSLEPGEYEVVLEQNAVADLLGYLGWLGCGAHAVREGRSFMSGNIGEPVTGPLVTITEDPLSPDGLYSPFDFEGVPRRCVTLIRSGVAVGPVYDLRSAALEGRSSTGHATHPRSRQWHHGPLPCSLFMDHGDADLEDLIGSVQRGLLVTRFHYLSPVSPAKTVLTGMTRDGTFLIEKGRIQGPVHNLRFAENILEAFRGIELISRERKLIYGEGPSAIVAPAVKLRKFRFVGTTHT